MLTFFNIGFSHNVKGSATTVPTVVDPVVAPASSSSAPPNPTAIMPNHVRYLTCAACEQGPIGVSLSNNEFYVEPERVAYS